MRMSFVAVLLSSTLLASPALSADKPVDHSSPQAVVKEFKQSMGNKNFVRAFECITPRSQKMLASVSLLVAGFAVLGDETKKKEVEELLKKHGLDQKTAGTQLKKIDDPKKLAKLFGEVMTWAEKNTPNRPGVKRKSISEQMAGTTFKNFKVEGDKATADVFRDDKQQRQPATFVKMKGKWLIDFKPPNRGRKAGKAKP